MKLITDNSLLMRHIPHSIKPVSGESPLFDKISVHIEAAERWVAQTFTGAALLDDTEALVPALLDALRRLVAAEALCRAIPALDLVLTPNGFGVVNTNTVAAASKQRVDRLVGSVRDLRDDAVREVLSLLPSAPGWTETQQARFFSDTLFPNIDLATLCGVTSGRWEKYLELRSRCIGIELTLAEDYFSPEMMSELRRELLAGDIAPQRLRLANAIRAQVVDVLLDRPINGTRMRDLVNYIRYNPEIFPTWHTSPTAQTFAPPKFINDLKSAGYWF